MTSPVYRIIALVLYAAGLRILAGVADARTGSIGLGQLFGGSLNLNPHLHTLAASGVFEKVDGGVRFQEAPPVGFGDPCCLRRSCDGSAPGDFN
jgi:Putative transposase